MSPALRGHACDHCLRRRRKCNLARPRCSLCEKLDIPCVGADQRRFIFKNVNPSPGAKDKSGEVSSEASSEDAVVPLDPARRVHSRGDNISIAFFPAKELQIVKAGIWVHDGPDTSLTPYIGSNDGFDSSVVALSTTFNHRASRFNLLRSYQKALEDVQKCISSPESALSLPTAHAVYFLQVSHAFVTAEGDSGYGHIDGLAQLGHALTLGNVRNVSVTHALDLLMCEIVNQAMFNPGIAVPPWIYTHARKERPEELSTCAHIIKTSRKRRQLELAADTVLRHGLFHKSFFVCLPELIRKPVENIIRVKRIYDMVRDVYPYLEVLKRDENAVHEEPWPESLSMSLYHQAYGAAIAVGILCNVFLSKSRFADEKMMAERAKFCADASAIGQRCLAELPFGGHHAPPAMMAAWLAAESESMRKQLQGLLDDYQGSWTMQYARHIVRIWPEAPPRLMELPWFPRGAGRLHREKDSALYRKRQKSLEVYETCCIL